MYFVIICSILFVFSLITTYFRYKEQVLLTSSKIKLEKLLKDKTLPDNKRKEILMILGELSRIQREWANPKPEPLPEHDFRKTDKIINKVCNDCKIDREFVAYAEFLHGDNK